MARGLDSIAYECEEVARHQSLIHDARLHGGEGRLKSVVEGRVSRTEQHATIVEELGDVVVFGIVAVDWVLLKVSTSLNNCAEKRCRPLAGSQGNPRGEHKKACARCELTWPGKNEYSSPLLASRLPVTRRPSCSRYERALENMPLSMGSRSPSVTSPKVSSLPIPTTPKMPPTRYVDEPRAAVAFDADAAPVISKGG